MPRLGGNTPHGPLSGGEQVPLLDDTYTTTGEMAALAGAGAITALSIVSGVVTIDLSLGRNFTLALTANVTSLVLSNVAGSGFASEYELLITQDGTGGRTFAIPASHKALGGSDTVIASAANAVTLLSAKTFNGGTTWRYAMQESA